MVSWIDASASLRYGLASVINLRELSVLDQPGELLERRFLVATVGLLALGESVNEEATPRLAANDQVR